ncbi:MAG: hypothetical protein ABIO70_20350 [Pseudomonadota bacterium]
MRLLPLLTLALTACTAKTDLGRYGDTAPPEDSASPEAVPVDVAFLQVLQRGDWLDHVTRCQVEVAFLDAGRPDGMGAGTAGQDIRLPTAPGTCEFTDFSEVPVSQGLWAVRGSREAGEVVTLSDTSRSLTLVQERDARDLPYYTLPDCDEASFPFGAVLDLDIPGDEGPRGVPAFSAEGCCAVGPDVILGPLPDPQDERGWLQHPQAEPLTLTWTRDGDLPEVDGTAVTATTYLMLRNFHPGEAQPFQALACLPDAEGTVTAPAADLALLEPNADLSTGDPYIAAQLDAWVEGPPLYTFLVRSTRITSVVTDGGIMLLLP